MFLDPGVKIINFAKAFLLIFFSFCMIVINSGTVIYWNVVHSHTFVVVLSYCTMIYFVTYKVGLWWCVYNAASKTFGQYFVLLVLFLCIAALKHLYVDIIMNYSLRFYDNSVTDAAFPG